MWFLRLEKSRQYFRAQFLFCTKIKTNYPGILSIPTLYHIWIIYNSKLTISAPAWYGGNASLDVQFVCWKGQNVRGILPYWHFPTRYVSTCLNKQSNQSQSNRQSTQSPVSWSIEISTSTSVFRCLHSNFCILWLQNIQFMVKKEELRIPYSLGVHPTILWRVTFFKVSA